jgi:hypothetical protein
VRNYLLYCAGEPVIKMSLIGDRTVRRSFLSPGEGSPLIRWLVYSSHEVLPDRVLFKPDTDIVELGLIIFAGHFSVYPGKAHLIPRPGASYGRGGFFIKAAPLFFMSNNIAPFL